jgi:hypothetical protein
MVHKLEMSLIRRKLYTLNYPKDVLDVITKISFSKGRNVEVGGSMGLKSQQYAGDYDLTETVVGHYKNKEAAATAFAKQFQSIVRGLLQTHGLFIGDIKAGEVPEWKVITGSVRNGRIVGYSAAQSRSRLAALKPYLSATDFSEAEKFIKAKPSLREFYEALDVLKFHVVRWSPAAVLRGYVVLLDGRHLTLAQAFNSPAMVKLDAVAYIQRSKFADFSIIFTFQNKKDTLNGVDLDFKTELENSMQSYYLLGSTYKAAKRLFSIAKNDNNMKLVEKLSGMFNSDLGRLYSIISDAKTIIYLLENKENVSIEKVRYEIDQFRARLGNIYSIGSVGSEKVLEKLLDMQELPSDAAGRQRLLSAMEKLVDFFDDALNKATVAYMKQEGITFPF